MLTEIRYQPGGDNRLLRHFLCTSWGQQCYWCGAIKDYNDLQIDHILPKDAGELARNRLKQELKLDHDFDPHAAYNLAPICGRCNREKGSDDYTNSPRLLSKLRMALRRAPEIARQARAFTKPGKLHAALLHAAEADLNEPTARQVFEDSAPAIVQRLASLDFEKADFQVEQIVEVVVGDRVHRVRITLNGHGRAAVATFENVAGGNLPEALAVPISQVLARAAASATSTIEMREQMGVPDVEQVTLEVIEIAVTKIELVSTPPAQLEFRFTGIIDTQGSTTVARANPVDGDLEYIQGDIELSAQFLFELFWTPENNIGSFDVGAVRLDELQTDSWLEGGGYADWR